MSNLLAKSKIMVAILCFSVAFVVLNLIATRAQEKSQSTPHFTSHGTQIMGAVDLYIQGEPQLQNGSQILAIAKKTKFLEAGSLEKKYNKGRIKYTPREATPDAIATALTEGLLLYKFTIEGTPPRKINLSPGTYYFFIQYVNGRWVGFAVDNQGTSRCTTFGVLVKEQLLMKPGKEHRHAPYIIAHKFATPDQLARLGQQLPFAAAAADDSDWTEAIINCKPIGNYGVWINTSVCAPMT